jgi:outer membrane receptor protein involved in Fe transport
MLRKTTIARALSMAFGATALTIGMSSTVLAQSNATGNIFGQVSASAGSSVVVESIDTGVRRTLTPDATGRFQANSLPTGKYKVQLVRNNAVVTTQEVEVLIGQGSEASFVTASGQTVEIVARRRTIDVSSTNNGSNFTAATLAKLPIAPTVSDIIQLAPGATRGDSRYGGSNAPSIGGASASENSFYINGFPVTNALTQVGGAQLPFGAIGQAQILSGGYSAEFGRSTGGVINVTTKSGTNNWEVGFQTYYKPDSLRANAKNIYYPVTGAAVNAGTDGRINTANEGSKVSTTMIGGNVGGPIIKDKLFMFLAFETTRTNSESARLTNSNPAVPISTAGWQEIQATTPRYVGKLDWNITDNHHLEFTRIGDRTNDDRKYFGFNYNTLQRTNVQAGGASYVNYGPTPIAAQVGMDVGILKYTGYLTDNLTLTALYGKSNTPHELRPAGFNPNLPQVQAPSAALVPGLTYVTPQGTTGNLLTPGAHDEQKGYRLDLEYKLGQHTLRAGVDENKIASVAGTSTAGGYVWIYGKTSSGSVKPVTTSNTPASGGGTGLQGYYVERDRFSAVSTPTVKQQAQYIEDRYQITPRLMVTLGLRNEQFSNYNGDGQVYIEQRHQLAPRLGASWDVNGDASLKVFGNAGRYHLQLPTNVAIRQAGASLNTREFYTYTGVDPTTGVPTGLTAISGVTSANNEFGQSKDPLDAAAIGMNSHYQDEISLGFEKAFSPSLNFGAKVTYRTLKSTIDDFCDQRPFDAWAVRNKVVNKFAFQCSLFNPGVDNDFKLDINGDGIRENIHLTAAELGYPSNKRTYLALDLFAEHPFRDGWYGKVAYTWSQSKGNTEGQTLSDIGQADVATTQAFDFPEIMLNSDGLLPNNRTHQIKAFGFYELTPQWTTGANLLLASGRPTNCIGNLPAALGGTNFATTPVTPATNPANDYGSAFFYCNQVATPRGSQGSLPWDTRLDLNLAYKVPAVKGLVLKVDVFNVMNKQTVANIEERYNVSGSDNIRPLSSGVISYTAPRSAKLSAEYNYKF